MHVEYDSIEPFRSSKEAKCQRRVVDDVRILARDGRLLLAQINEVAALPKAGILRARIKLVRDRFEDRKHETPAEAA